MKQQYIIIVVVLVVIIVGAVVWKNNAPTSTSENTASTEEIASAGDPVEATVAFYKQWLEAVQDNTLSPYTSGVLENPILSSDVRSYIENAKETGGPAGVDPVLCQSVTPEKIRAKATFVLDDTAEVMVLGRGQGTKSSEQAAVRLEVIDGAWKITNIGCYAGESAPEREFTFEKEGFVLKGVPPQLNPEYWYLVFEENGEAGHTAPLLFDAESICVTTDESEAVCDPEQFVNPSKAFVQAQMTEAGAQVKRLQFMAQ